MEWYNSEDICLVDVCVAWCTHTRVISKYLTFSRRILVSFAFVFIFYLSFFVSNQFLPINLSFSNFRFLLHLWLYLFFFYFSRFVSYHFISLFLIFLHSRLISSRLFLLFPRSTIFYCPRFLSYPFSFFVPLAFLCKVFSFFLYFLMFLSSPLLSFRFFYILFSAFFFKSWCMFSRQFLISSCFPVVKIFKRKYEI